MTGFSKGFTSAGGILAAALVLATAGHAVAADEKPAPIQNASYNGLTCDHVRAKVAESGVVGAYAYARYMGMTSRDIARVRKACSV